MRQTCINFDENRQNRQILLVTACIHQHLNRIWAQWVSARSACLRTTRATNLNISSVMPFLPSCFCNTEFTRKTIKCKDSRRRSMISMAQRPERNMLNWKKTLGPKARTSIRSPKRTDSIRMRARTKQIYKRTSPLLTCGSRPPIGLGTTVCLEPRRCVRRGWVYTMSWIVFEANLMQCRGKRDVVDAGGVQVVCLGYWQTDKTDK